MVAYLDVEDFDKAIQSSLNVLKRNPKHQHALELLHNLGCDQVRGLLKEDRHRQAVRLLQSFIQVEPTYPPYYLLLGETFLEGDAETEAEDALTKCIELEENRALAHAQVGKVYMSAGHFEQGEAHFKAAGFGSPRQRLCGGQATRKRRWTYSV